MAQTEPRLPDAERGRRRAAPGESRREKRGASAEKRQAILDRSIEVFAEKGYHETRISDIAKRADVAYGLVYHYFANKEEILDTIFQERWGAFIEGVRGIVESERTAEDKLLAVAAVVLLAHRRHPEWVKILIFEVQRTQRMLAPDRMEVVGELFRLVARILREGQASGELRPDLDPEIACYIFIGGIDIVVTSRVLELMPDDPAHSDGEGGYPVHLARTAVDLFLHGMAAPRAAAD